MQVESADRVLREMLLDGNSLDRWAAVQCLGHAGRTDATVIRELIKQLLNTYGRSNDPNVLGEMVIRRQQAMELIKKLGKHSPLVLGMLSEQLNNVSYRIRIAVCDCIPVVAAIISRDIAQKLVSIMWYKRKCKIYK